MIQLRRLWDYKEKPQFGEYLDGITRLCANYTLAEITYNDQSSKNVWLIRRPATNGFIGFAEIELKDADFTLDSRIYIYVHQLHIAPAIQRAGVGRAVFRHLLKKGLDIEFTVAKCNEKARGLVEKFNYREKYVTQDTITVQVDYANNAAALGP